MAKEILIGAAAAGSVITLILAISAVGVPRWIDYSTTSLLGTMRTYRGFWQKCVELNNNVACTEIQHTDKKDFEVATIVMMAFGMIAILVAFINMIVYPGKENARRRAAVASVVAGAFFLIAVSIYGGMAKKEFGLVVAEYYGASFALAIVSLFFSLINAIIFTVTLDYIPWIKDGS
ncbi:hypothetical protein CHS0354_034613 [Potamilus streckersoni]|uniref:Claudin n=1 Tax=Potamilus streckersoni TaxID=2493646 RepID=A0AAE0STJ1_9BIVA|nr:hypothetical protein CHS0354_034613 [Potamilus streckersoni]